MGRKVKKSFIMVFVWILFSLGISGIAYSQVADNVNFKKTAVETQATITDVAVHPSNGRARVDATYTYYFNWNCIRICSHCYFRGKI